MQTIMRSGGAVAACLVLLAVSDAAAAREVEVPLPGPGAFSTTIDNPYWPLPMTATFAYRAEAEDGCEYDKATVTTDTRAVTIGGDTYTVLIVRDQAWEDEGCDLADVAMVEDTQDYYAQDDDGNIWYFGEATFALPEEGNACDIQGSWEAGVSPQPGADPAEPGVVMLAEPEAGDRYRQELAEDVAEDWAAVLRPNGNVSTDRDDYDDCLITKEWSPLEPGAVERKYYCLSSEDGGPDSNNGLVYIAELKGKTLRVEYIGDDFEILGGPGFTLPGEEDAGVLFPSDDLSCVP